MIDIARWNYKTKSYDPYKPNPKWTVVLVSHDMGLPMNCANCGMETTFGDSFTSLELHTSVGFGYPVCEGCYEQEYDRKIESKQTKEEVQ